MEFFIVYFSVGAFILWVVVQSAVKSGIDSSETSKMVKKYMELKQFEKETSDKNPEK